MKNNVVTRMLNPFFKEIWGENPLTFYFSFKGTFNRLQFWGALITINVFVNLIDIQDFWLLFVLAFPIAFCATLAALQKRCRDINYNGTIATLAYSLTFLHDFKHVTLPDCLNDIWGVFGISYMVIAVFLVLFPGRKEKKSDIADPLLKRPYLYVLVWSILFWLGEAILYNQDLAKPAGV